VQVKAAICFIGRDSAGSFGQYQGDTATRILWKILVKFLEEGI
jgi:hypothetical protein